MANGNNFCRWAKNQLLQKKLLLEKMTKVKSKVKFQKLHRNLIQYKITIYKDLNPKTRL